MITICMFGLSLVSIFQRRATHQIMVTCSSVAPYMKGARVEALQADLAKAGIDIAKDGIFGKDTDQAVKTFQRRMFADDDGIVGPRTLAKLSALVQTPTVAKETLGIKHKNYLNVKNNPSDPWKGSIGTDDRGHTIFDDPVYGIRAAIITLRTYWFRYNKRTIAEILATWAPASDTIGSLPDAPPNSPPQYSEFVTGRTGIDYNQPLDFFDAHQQVKNKAQLTSVIKAMAEYENYAGFDFPDAIVDQAIQLIEGGQVGSSDTSQSGDATVVSENAPMTFTLKPTHLKHLCQINHFAVPEQGMIFFALRGCLPGNMDDQSFRSEHAMRLTPINYRSPHCTLIQWLPEQDQMALFPGSTIPYIDSVAKAKAKGGKGANQMMTGYYRQGYERGRHYGSVPHEAFLQVGKRAVRRTADDLDYDAEDRVEVSNPDPLWDNLHCGRCQTSDDERFYASAGCQVVAGYPEAEGYTESGPWKIFKQNAYGRSQQQFPYVLLSGNSARSVALDDTGMASPRLRYGSTGKLVEAVQRALQEQGFYSAGIDGDFGPGTLRAVLNFQEAKFGADQDDGIVGPMTAKALGVAWPEVKLVG